MTPDEARNILDKVIFWNYRFIVTDMPDFYLQGVYLDADVDTSKREDQHTRKWRLSQWMTKSELVATAFKLVMTSMEHRAREGFTYNGQRIYGPHFNVDDLAKLAETTLRDKRPTPDSHGVVGGH